MIDMINLFCGMKETFRRIQNFCTKSTKCSTWMRWIVQNTNLNSSCAMHFNLCHISFDSTFFFFSFQFVSKSLWKEVATISDCPFVNFKVHLLNFFQLPTAQFLLAPLVTVPFFVPVKGSTTNISLHNILSCTVFYTIGFLKIIIKINSWTKRNMWIRTEMFHFSTTKQKVNNNYRVV